ITVSASCPRLARRRSRSSSATSEPNLANRGTSTRWRRRPRMRTSSETITTSARSVLLKPRRRESASTRMVRVARGSSRLPRISARQERSISSCNFT
ncbi:hypothetical protein KEM56_006093, partial [Ascosphaera pollenicola]